MTTVLTAKDVTAGYGELALVELPAIDCLASLGWETANLYNETFGIDGTEGRKSSAEVILVPRLKKALERINPDRICLLSRSSTHRGFPRPDGYLAPD